MKRESGASPPPVSLVRRNDTHRLILSKYSIDESTLGRIAENEAHLKDLLDLDGITNDRLLAENEMLPSIGIRELVFNVPHYRIINAAFAHAHPLGSRFNGPDRGVWYAAFELQTAQMEVAFHKTLHLAEIGRFEDEVSCDDYLADFSAEFHDLRDEKAFADCLDPNSYVKSQGLAERLLEIGSLGIVYPSVRCADGVRIACFQPAVVGNVRKGGSYRFRWQGEPRPVIEAIVAAGP